LKPVIPRTNQPDAEGIIVNSAGGITGGDDFTVSAMVGAGAAFTLIK